ncbi:MAG: MFS transporter [Pseudomonadota bacterium]|nr:MFS transporter [Pseudomonadota bacterium]
MLVLILAGEIIFSLPFHLARYYRPSFLGSLGLSNTELGDIFAIYGLSATAAYFLGGPIADRLPAKRLMVFSLIATACGGPILLLLPSVLLLKILYGYWGLTTILLFWAPLIRTTRNWGGNLHQGRAFGFLDGGRGLIAALVASVGVLILSHSLTTKNGIDGIVVYYVCLTLVAAFSVMFMLPTDQPSKQKNSSLLPVNRLLRNKLLWLQAAVLTICYCCYKGIDHYALYVNQVWGMSETESAAFAAGIAYARPVSAIAAGLIADRFGASKSILTIFIVLFCTYLSIAAMTTDQIFYLATLLIMFTSAAGVFALRGIYFAVLEESKIPTHQTGLAVGLISFVGFTPDIFFAPVAGRLLDSAPGLIGHQLYFQMLAIIATSGLIIASTLVYFITRGEKAK